MWRVFWDTGYITKFPPEIWRFITSFLITNPQFGIILDPYFLYMYLSELERGNSRFPRREDLVWYLIFVSTTMVVCPNSFSFYIYMILSPLLLSVSLYICPHSGHPTAIAVPENEEDHPCI